MDADVVNKLKEKICYEFDSLICKIKKGYKPDYEFILEEISLIELIQSGELDEKLLSIALQYYINNKWKMLY